MDIFRPPAVFIAALLLVGGSFAPAAPLQREAVPLDSERAGRVPVVLRVRFVTPGQGSKYLWPEVELVSVLKNESRHVFPKRFHLAHYSWEPGIPPGTSTVYLERYNPDREDLWRLLDGSSKAGVSDTTNP